MRSRTIWIDLDRFEITAIQRKPKDDKESGPDERAANLHADGCIDYLQSARAVLSRESLDRYGHYFGTDFARVRIHCDARSAVLCESYEARAFTHGNKIHFNRREYDPVSSKGQKLLAHELTHVVQQGAVPPLAKKSEPDTNMKIRPTFRRSARRVFRSAPAAPFFQTEGPEPAFFIPAFDIQKKPAEMEPEHLEMAAEKEPVDEIQARREYDNSGRVCLHPGES